MRSSYYEFRIAGVLPPEALQDYEQLTASLEPVETVLQGPLPGSSSPAQSPPRATRDLRRASGKPSSSRATRSAGQRRRRQPGNGRVAGNARIPLNQMRR